MRNFIGKGDFLWFVGVVEDRNDPIKMGRVRVRCFGWHTDDKTQIPTNSLPWAVVMNNTNSASVSGIGDSPTGIVEGTWVIGFFMDGERAQEPTIMGTLPGMPSNYGNPNAGFNDPNRRSQDSENVDYDKSVYPRSYDEPDVNALARGTQTKTHTLDTTIQEPADPYAAVYPKNQVFESESGHIKEYDDTTNHERIRERHKSGSFYEIHPDGKKVTYVVANNYTVIAGDDKVHVSGNVAIHIDSNATMNIAGNWDVNVTGDVTIDGRTINLNNGSQGAARIGDTADTGDAVHAVGSNQIESGSKTVFIGD